MQSISLFFRLLIFRKLFLILNLKSLSTWQLPQTWFCHLKNFTEDHYNVGDPDSILGLERSPGEGNGYPPQDSCLENSMDSTVHGVAKSRTWLSNFHFFHFIKGCCDHLQGIFPTQRSNPCLLRWQEGSLSLAPPGKPIIKDTDEQLDE